MRYTSSLCPPFRRTGSASNAWRPFLAKATTEQVDITSCYEIATRGTESGWL